MTLPRPIRLGETVMAQKRCYRGEFRLRPTSEVNQLLEYVLAYCAHKYEIELHEFVVMSSHHHIELTDRIGNRPAFFQSFHSLVARALNCLFKEGDAVFSSQRYSAPVLLEGEDAFERCVYILLNPVEARIVRHPREWLGVCSYGLEYNRPKIIKRPRFFFSGDMPETVKLEIQRPEYIDPQLNNKELRGKIRKTVKDKSYAIVSKIREEGRNILGMKRALRIPRHHAARDRMSSGGLKNTSIRPHVACKNRRKRVAYLVQLKEFWVEHRRAFLRQQQGESDVIFPEGTYKARVSYGMKCRPPPD